MARFRALQKALLEPGFETGLWILDLTRFLDANRSLHFA
jgi:hypothetical protein